MDPRTELISKLAAEGHVRSQALIVLLQESSLARADLDTITSELSGNDKFKRKGLISRMARVELAVLVALVLAVVGAVNILGWDRVSKLLGFLG